MRNPTHSTNTWSTQHHPVTCKTIFVANFATVDPNSTWCCQHSILYLSIRCNRIFDNVDLVPNQNWKCIVLTQSSCHKHCNVCPIKIPTSQAHSNPSPHDISNCSRILIVLRKTKEIHVLSLFTSSYHAKKTCNTVRILYRPTAIATCQASEGIRTTNTSIVRVDQDVACILTTVKTSDLDDGVIADKRATTCTATESLPSRVDALP